MNIDDRLRKLNDIAQADDRDILTTLCRAVAATHEGYKSDYTAAKLKDYQAAQKARDALAETLWSKYFPDDMTLKNQPAVLLYLKQAGWKIEKSALNNHVRSGKIRPRQDGAFGLQDVEKYAAMFLKRLDARPTNPALDKFLTDRAEADLEARNTQNAILRLELDAKRNILIPRADFDHQMAARAQILRSDAENFARGKAQAIISLVNGDDTKTPELVELLLAEIENWFARYTDQEYSIPIPHMVAIHHDNGNGLSALDVEDEPMEEIGR